MLIVLPVLLLISPRTRQLAKVFSVCPSMSCSPIISIGRRFIKYLVAFDDKLAGEVHVTLAEVAVMSPMVTERVFNTV